jgi:hypothetical protein
METPDEKKRWSSEEKEHQSGLVDDVLLKILDIAGVDRLTTRGVSKSLSKRPGWETKNIAKKVSNVKLSLGEYIDISKKVGGPVGFYVKHPYPLKRRSHTNIYEKLPQTFFIIFYPLSMKVVTVRYTMIGEELPFELAIEQKFFESLEDAKAEIIRKVSDSTVWRLSEKTVRVPATYYVDPFISRYASVNYIEGFPEHMVQPFSYYIVDEEFLYGNVNKLYYLMIYLLTGRLNLQELMRKYGWVDDFDYNSSHLLPLDDEAARSLEELLAYSRSFVFNSFDRPYGVEVEEVQA